MPIKFVGRRRPGPLKVSGRPARKPAKRGSLKRAVEAPVPVRLEGLKVVHGVRAGE